MKTQNQYFKVIKSRQDYKGVRYFCFNPMSEKVVQVTVNQGEIKKGRASVFGVGLIHRLGFLTTYLSMSFVEPCSKKEYEQSFNKVVDWLKV